eukprot:1146099-Pelagomonas_calceolata.AAC.1
MHRHNLVTTWIAFKETTRTHESTPERPNSPAPEFKQFYNPHDALRTHMHPKDRLGKLRPRQDTTLKRSLKVCAGQQPATIKARFKSQC